MSPRPVVHTLDPAHGIIQESGTIDPEWVRPIEADESCPEPDLAPASTPVAPIDPAHSTRKGPKWSRELELDRATVRRDARVKLQHPTTHVQTPPDPHLRLVHAPAIGAVPELFPGCAGPLIYALERRKIGAC